MSKSTSMLPTLAGGSGVAAHTLVDADLMKVVDAVTLNADRDRKVTLGELKAYFTGSLAPAVHESMQTETVALAASDFHYFESCVLTPGTWLVSGSSSGTASSGNTGAMQGQIRVSDGVSWVRKGPSNVNTGITGGLVSVSVPTVLVDVPNDSTTYTVAFRVDNLGTTSLSDVYAHLLCHRVETA